MDRRADRQARPGAGSRPSGPSRAARPAARRSGGPGNESGAAARTSAPRQPGRFTSRAVVLGVVLAVLGLSYVYPLRVYLSQQAQIAQRQADQREQLDRIEELTAAAQRWSDDEYVRIQARERLHYGEPGEVLLIPVREQPDPPQTHPGDAPEPPPAPWWDTLWASVESANGSGAR